MGEPLLGRRLRPQGQAAVVGRGVEPPLPFRLGFGAGARAGRLATARWPGSSAASQAVAAPAIRVATSAAAAA